MTLNTMVIGVLRLSPLPHNALVYDDIKMPVIVYHVYGDTSHHRCHEYALRCLLLHAINMLLLR